MKIDITNLKICYLAMIGISIISLGSAYFIEHVMLIQPCILCIYQRVPYFVLGTLALIGFILNNRINHRKINSYILICIMINIIIGAIIAGYHTGVERKIFKPTQKCRAHFEFSDTISISENIQMLYAQSMASCSEVALEIFGLSLTEWNLLLNIAILSYITIVFKRNRYVKTNISKSSI